MDAALLPDDPIGPSHLSSEERLEERSLVVAVQNGDEEAFEQLYNANRGRVLAVALSILAPSGSGSEAEDAADEAMVGAWVHIKTFRLDSSFLSWVRSIVTHNCLSRLRSGQRRAVRDREWLEALQAEAECSVDGTVILTDTERVFTEQLLRRLPEKERVIIEKRFIRGQSTSQIAADLSLNVNQVNGRKFRALGKLRKWLTKK